MDLSELKAMEDKIALLEEIKNREVKLNEEIKVLTKEKIDALKENEKSVTIIQTHRTVETLLTHHSGETIIRKIAGIIGVNTKKLVAAYAYRSHGHNMYSQGDALELTYKLHELGDLLFVKKPERVGAVEETVTRKGLDEVGFRFEGGAQRRT